MQALRLSLTLAALTSAAAACTPSVQIAQETEGGTLGAEAGSVGHDSGNQGDTASSGCAGEAPECFGTNSEDCCGDRIADAVCMSGQWMCGDAVAPGCRGKCDMAPDSGPPDSGSPDVGGGNAKACDEDPITLDPPGAVLDVHGTQTFMAIGGSGTERVWSISPNLSGGTVDASGLYTAGSTNNVTDVVEVVDSLGCHVTVTVFVGAINAAESPATGGQPKFACGNKSTECESATEYCYIIGQGDDGTFPMCKTYPSTCASAPTCSCLTAGMNGTCQDENGDFNVAEFAEAGD
jgi:hypothetical protein